MITALSTSNYGCLQAVELGLTPFHALVGPNDAGKSTILRALRTLAQFASGAFTEGGTRPFDPWLPEGAHIELGLPWLRARTPRGSYYLTCVQGSLTESFDEVPGFNPTSTNRPLGRGSGYATDDHYSPVLHQIGPARLLRLDPEAMRRPSPILRDGRPVDFADETGAGVAAVLQAMNGRDVERFLALQGAVRGRFSGVRKLQLRFDDATSPNVLFHATLADGRDVDASRVSDGLLYFLAFSALDFLAPTPLLLVEEPERGLDPAGVKNVMAALRAFHKTTQTQVIIATHSHHVINEMSPEEVTVVTRPDHERGTAVAPIERTHDFARRAASLKLGEVWLALEGGADGQAPRSLGGAFLWPKRRRRPSRSPAPPTPHGSRASGRPARAITGSPTRRRAASRFASFSRPRCSPRQKTPSISRSLTRRGSPAPASSPSRPTRTTATGCRSAASSSPTPPRARSRWGPWASTSAAA